MPDLLVTYDVSTTTAAGQKRLRKVAKACEAFGQRVQYSVFEVSVNPVQGERLRARLTEIIDPKEDSLRIYTLRGRREESVEAYGRDLYVDFKGPLIL
jgi:CRISPR-associated protein Cas2